MGTFYLKLPSKKSVLVVPPITIEHVEQKLEELRGIMNEAGFDLPDDQWDAEWITEFINENIGEVNWAQQLAQDDLSFGYMLGVAMTHLEEAEDDEA